MIKVQAQSVLPKIPEVKFHEEARTLQSAETYFLDNFGILLCIKGEGESEERKFVHNYSDAQEFFQ